MEALRKLNTTELYPHLDTHTHQVINHWAHSVREHSVKLYNRNIIQSLNGSQKGGLLLTEILLSEQEEFQFHDIWDISLEWGDVTHSESWPTSEMFHFKLLSCSQLLLYRYNLYIRNCRYFCPLSLSVTVTVIGLVVLSKTASEPRVHPLDLSSEFSLQIWRWGVSLTCRENYIKHSRLIKYSQHMSSTTFCHSWFKNYFDTTHSVCTVSVLCAPVCSTQRCCFQKRVRIKWEIPTWLPPKTPCSLRYCARTYQTEELSEKLCSIQEWTSDVTWRANRNNS